MICSVCWDHRAVFVDDGEVTVFIDTAADGVVVKGVFIMPMTLTCLFIAIIMAPGLETNEGVKEGYVDESKDGGIESTRDCDSGVHVDDGRCDTVGSPVGAFESFKDGVTDDILVDSINGFPNGICDGLAEGNEDGRPDGKLDGASVGMLDGSADGLLVGRSDGVTEG